MSENIVQNIEKLLQNPNLVSKKWIYEQYDSQVMNDTLQIKGDAALTRVHGTKKAIASSTDCTPRYVEADPFEGAKQAVAENYRNISAVGAKPLAITNCLNFGNPEKPEIMGQIVKAIKGITEASKKLNYPVVSGNVSLYNETDGKAIKPTPAIGGVGLIKNASNRCSVNFKSLGDQIFIIGSTNGHLGCSLYEQSILGKKTGSKPPQVDLDLERKNSDFIREIIERGVIRSCHDISDGGIITCLFEKCNRDLACAIDFSQIESFNDLTIEQILFAEDQARFIVSVDTSSVDRLLKKAQESDIQITKIGEVTNGNITIKNNDDPKNIEINLENIKKINENYLGSKMQ